MQKLLHQTLANIVTTNPATAQVLEQFGFDYCCGGKISLAEACKQKSVNPAQVLQAIDAIVKKTKNDNQINLNSLTIPQLVEHILNSHHAYLKEIMPRLNDLIGRVVKAHSSKHPELLELQSTYTRFHVDMNEHLLKEENILFPILQHLGDNTDISYLGMVSCPIQVMQEEHDQAGELLSKMRQLTNDFQVPADGCSTYLVMLTELLKLEQDTHQHVHKENNILFPKVMAPLEHQEIT